MSILEETEKKLREMMDPEENRKLDEKSHQLDRATEELMAIMGAYASGIGVGHLAFAGVFLGKMGRLLQQELREIPPGYEKDLARMLIFHLNPLAKEFNAIGAKYSNQAADKAEEASKIT